MILELHRVWLTSKSAIGKLYVDSAFECYTLEDTVRPEGVKIAGETAIPEGTYEIAIDFSARFKRRMPHVLGVPGFDGIRIHAGNTEADTEGCILVGNVRGEGRILESKAAFQHLFGIMDHALENGNKVVLVIKNPEGASLAAPIEMAGES